MQPDRQRGGLERRQVLGQQGAGHTRQHIAQARAGHGRMAAVAQRQPAIGRGDQRTCALEQRRAAITRRQRANRPRTVRLDLRHAGLQQPRRFAGVRRDQALARQRDGTCRQQIQRIGIPYLRHLTLRRQRQQTAPPRRLTKAWADHQHVGTLDECRQPIGGFDAMAHDLRLAHQRGRDMLRACCQAHHAGTATQRCLGTQQRGAASAQVTAYHQHLAEAALVRGG